MRRQSEIKRTPKACHDEEAGGIWGYRVYQKTPLDHLMLDFGVYSSPITPLEIDGVVRAWEG